MAYQALYRAWRPERFGDVVGQEPIVTTLVHQIESGRIAHAYLFCGSRGTGKTSTAKVLARAINCQSLLPGAEPCGVCETCKSAASGAGLDIMEIDAASNNGVDEIRDLRERIAYAPSVGKYKVYIIDEVHMLSTGAFNALLKTLEEPPEHAVFILATTEPQKLPATILSRCQRFDFKRIPIKTMIARLETVLSGIQRQADTEALEIIARAAEGGMRDALSLMDMCLSYGDGVLTSDLVRNILGSSDKTFLFDFAQKLLEGHSGDALTDIARLVQDGKDLAVFLKDVIAHFRTLLIAQLVNTELADLLEVTQEDADRYRAQADNVPREALMRRMDLFISAEGDLKWVSQPRSLLELCVVRACHSEREDSAEALTERVAQLERALAEGRMPAAEKPKEKVKEKPAPKAKSVSAAAPASESPAPTGPEQDLWKKVMEEITAEEPSMPPLLNAIVFGGIEGDQAILEIPRKWQMYLNVINNTNKKQLIEKKLSDLAGRPITARLSIQGTRENAAAPNRAKGAMAQICDVFGRENVVVIDD